MRNSPSASWTTRIRSSEREGEVAAEFELELETAGAESKLLVVRRSTPGPVLVGQSVSCALRTKDPLVSRRHASFEYANDGLIVRDLGSTNGVFLGNTKIVEAVLSGGERLRLGADSFIAVRRVDAKRTSPLSTRTSFGGVVGSSVAMRRLYPLLEKIAAAHIPILIEGETGVGKELLAEAIHQEGPRAHAPFVVIDCTAIPPSLVESELFGHERGAFTGATAARKGLFERAHGGTLLIDEIGELDLQLQPKLLRALERGEVKRVGSDTFLKVDVRILAATRRNLDEEVAAGRFRDDLFHRLAVGRVELPPLRARREDIALLVKYFWRREGGDEASLPQQEQARWQAMEWPGNVRELRNTISRFAALGALSESEATTSAAPRDETSMDDILKLDVTLSEARRLVLERLERSYVRRVLARSGGSTTAAADAAGVVPRHLRRLAARLREDPR